MQIQQPRDETSASAVAQPTIPTEVSGRELRKKELMSFVEGLNLEKCRKLVVEAYCCSGGIERAKVIVQDELPHQPREPAQPLSWCICGRCQPMDRPIEMCVVESWSVLLIWKLLKQLF